MPTKQSTNTPDVLPLKRDIRSPGAWKYLASYVLLGASAVLIVMEIIKSGMWRAVGGPLLGIGLAIWNLFRLQAAERKSAEPTAAAMDADKPLR